ncbi:Ger(x)C family spore germination protein [Psychrobacillus sp.]|uniref:Ger(x)C family spore germination protein n=1 Tax=Psychrobacillus sp. TaxID=1871623 RepID=UPI0028BDC40A|nr:Ger(x)C family spore germination protein [Psychrobacillus sp.]
MKKHIIVLLILSLLLTGCWDSRELNEIAITLAIGIDKVEDEYQITVQVVVPSEVSIKTGTGRSTVTLFQANGNTVYEAFRKMTKDSPRKIYPGHLRMLVLGEELALEGIGDSLDLFARDWEFRSDFYVVVAKNRTAAEILNITTTLENIPANKMFEALKTSDESWSATRGIKLHELIADISSEGKEAVLTGILAMGNQEIGASKQNVETITPSARIQYGQLAIFKKDKLVGWLSERESRGYNDIINSVKTTVMPIACPKKGTLTIEVTDLNSVIKSKVINENPEVDVNIRVKGNIGEVECQINLSELKTIHELEKIYENELKEIVNETIDNLQNKYKSDIFGFGEAIHRSNPKEWKRIKKQWDSEFPDLEVNVEVDMQIQRTGTINNSLLKKE